MTCNGNCNQGRECDCIGAQHAGDDPMERIAALEAERDNLKAMYMQQCRDSNAWMRLNTTTKAHWETAYLALGHKLSAAESERDTLRQQLETAREALKAWDCLIEYQFTGSSESMNALMNASQLGVEALAAIGEAQPTSAEVKSVPDGWQLVPKKITSEMIDAMCQQLGFSGAAVSSAYYDALAAAPTYPQQPRPESEIAAEALEEAAEKQEPVGIIEQLWAIIDDIDTYGDMAKSDDKLFRSLVERRQKDRWKTGITTDGYTLTIPTHPAPAVPEGWQLVPKEPTNEMHIAATNYDYENPTDPTWKNIYKVMLAAAPKPEGEKK